MQAVFVKSKLEAWQN